MCVSRIPASLVPPVDLLIYSPLSLLIKFAQLSRPIIMDPRDGAAKDAKAAKTKALLDKAYDSLVTSQLSKIDGSDKKRRKVRAKITEGMLEDDEELYRQTMALEREAELGRERKTLSKEHEELARTTGLSGQVVALMASGGQEDGSNGGERRRRKDDRKKKRNRKGGRKRDHKSRSRKKESRKRRRKRSYSSDSYSSYSSDSYSTDSSYERKKRRKKRSKKERRREGDRKAHKRDEKLERDSKAETRADSAHQFGKYGIIKESDLSANRRSFDAWLAEVKGVASFTGPKWELQNYFKDFCEDFNTATMPHEKYYDLEKWEMEEYERQRAKAEETAAKTGSTARSDEIRHREEMIRKEEEKKRAELDMVRQTLKSGKIEEMKAQAALRTELEIAYKTGDQAKVKKLKKKLEPEEKRYN